jgi:2,4-dienoyl-CoA reductase-like NADH-dependent reductase (Old Yellow Enzyme family)
VTAVTEVFAPARLGPVTLRNPIIKAATFEGMARRGLVTDALVDYHEAVARGGVGMTTLAYCAVSDDGRGAPGEIVVTDDAVPGLARLVEAVHGHGAAASIQLGHAGPVAAGTGHRGLAPSRVFSPRAMRPTHAASDDDLARVVRAFVDAARRSVDAGFDALELHFGHGYLVSAFLSPKLNRRTDRWGGTVENRARLARQVASEVREAVGGRVAVVAKFNMADGVRGGLWLDESLVVARLLASDGTLDALELTGGSSFENPMYLFRGEAPIAEMAEVFPRALRAGFRLTAKRFMVEYPFEEAYFLPYARQFRDAVDLPLILLGGINRLDTVRGALDEGFPLVAMGRALLREPDLVRRWQSGDAGEGLCVHCNKCMPTIYRGTHCVLVPADERPGTRLRGRTGTAGTPVDGTSVEQGR